MYIDKYKKENGYFDEENCFYPDIENFIQTKILGFCACADPYRNLRFIRDILTFINNNNKPQSLEEREKKVKELFKTREIKNFIFYVLDEKGLTEHGSCIPGWLTLKGEQLLEDLNEYFNNKEEIMVKKSKELSAEVIEDKELTENHKEENPNYFLTKEKVKFFSSGCTQLDSILGGGWAERRIFNIIGDKSTSKTILSIEACINFLLKYPDGRIIYAETEAAFDRSYAEKIGLAFDQKNITLEENIGTVEQLYNKLLELSGIAEEDEIKSLKKDSKINTAPTLVIVDSWDGLSDVAEMERDISEASFGGTRPKQSHALFRKLTRKITSSNITLGIVSQVKDNIGVTFGNKETIACKHAIEFWSSQRIWLAHVKHISKSIDGIEMTQGNIVRAKCAKNKVGRPHRICEFPVYYDMGINDLEANINWLHEIGKLNSVDFAKYDIEIPKRLSTLMDKCIENEKFNEIRQELSNYSKQCWNEIEEKFKPPYKKY